MDRDAGRWHRFPRAAQLPGEQPAGRRHRGDLDHPHHRRVLHARTPGHQRPGPRRAGRGPHAGLHGARRPGQRPARQRGDPRQRGGLRHLLHRQALHRPGRELRRLGGPHRGPRHQHRCAPEQLGPYDPGGRPRHRGLRERDRAGRGYRPGAAALPRLPRTRPRGAGHRPVPRHLRGLLGGRRAGRGAAGRRSRLPGPDRPDGP